ncbi:ABC transporter permease [Oricola indica]|uniref:ABC transporter permease n=1 Tax=Oricola indica TaxID=2872591 RepID=UPI003CCBFB1C
MRIEIGRFAVAAILILALVIAALFLPRLLSSNNVLQVLRQASIPGVIAIGVTFVVISGRLDLSVGSMLSLCSVVLITVHESVSPVAGILAALAVGLAAGGVNGILVGYLGLNSLITTLGMLSLLQGIALVYTGGQNALIAAPSEAWFSVFGRGFLSGIPVPVIVLFVLGTVMSLLLTRTVFGRRVFAVGANPVAARHSAVPVRSVIFTAYLISGLMTACAAILLSSRVMAARLDSGSGYELTVLAGIILGGTSLLGGSGGIWRAIFGIVVLAFIQNALLLMGLPYYIQWLVTWTVIIGAVSADVIGKRGKVFAS